MSFSVKIIGVAAGIALASSAFAQQPQQQNPADVVPPNMPFDIPYGAPISAEKALTLIVAANAESKRHGWKMNIAVLDSGGNLVAFLRETGGQIGSIEIAQKKAKAAVNFRRETKVFEAAIAGGNNNLITLPGVIASRGGIPIVDNGAIVGAIGVSGGTGSQDEVVAKAAIAAYR